MAALRAAEVEVLITADDKDVARAEKNVKASGERIEKKPIVAKVNADEKDALAGMDRVETAAKRIVTAKTMATVDANIERAEKSFMRVYERLDYLKSVSPNVEVTAEISRAEANLSRVQRSLDGLRAAKAVMEVDANTVPAEEALDAVADKAGQAGEKGGLDAGSAIVGGILGALASIPIAGALAPLAEGVGSAVRSGFEEGLAIEARFDRLAALTGLQEADALRLGRAAGEAYANVFGESIEANMDTARLALQFNIIDADASTRDAQRVVQGLSGIADVLGEDIRPIAQAVTVMLSSGVARSADHAFDILATGAREGVNRSEDLLDTFTEYPALFARLGLTGDEALGLINQGLDAGAFNSDKVADALKELQIRATDASESSAEGYRLIGLNAEEMTAKMAAGGSSAREGLDQILDGLRGIEDPVARNAAGVALIGAQWEDLGDSILALDLSTAVDQLNGVDGAAQRMFDTLAANDATRIQQAQRNIEVAAQGIQGALAAAFSEPLGDLANFVSQNRGPVMQFILDLANAGLDFGVGVVEGVATGTEALGGFVSGPLADFVYSIADVLGKLPWPFNQDTSELKAAVEEMRGFEDATTAAADIMRENWIGTIEDARDRLNEFGEGAVAMGYLNDASLVLAENLSAVGYAADGSRLSLEGVDLANLAASSSGAILEGQIRNSVAALEAELAAAAAAGEGQDALKGRYDAATGALVGQLTQMGLTEQQARDLIATYGAVPGMVSTVMTADTSPAQNSVEAFIRKNAGRRFNMYIDAINAGGGGGRGALSNARGNLVEFMAGGGLRSGLTPMQSIAQMVPPNTWRVTGDRGDVDESFIPVDGSARSWAILMETMQRMLSVSDGPGGTGGAPPTGRRPGPPPVQIIHNGNNYAFDPREQAREQKLQFTRALDVLPPT
ncbi:phage tail tape measure protein [Microbacterium sp. CFH 90308]|uniref:Phage tail tape measure protein n=1 Tax=Microbacterium salsuginis TaxID=2722803 RepID=A0ABX1K851_9MICO|nr:phage tail tape measure protein [Microbacterium sp. CFH 90308]NLP82585.1 phage tail tape measure protein [Microbacterium sp. CFH 90308]